MNKFNIRSAVSLAKSEYIRWITNPRMIIIAVLLIFSHSLVIVPLLERAEKYGEKLNVLEPFLAIGNSKMLVLFIPCVFLILVSDYPVISGNTLFFIHRTGKINWFFGQILFILSVILSYLSFVLLFSILASEGKIGTGWSDTVTKYNAMFPNEAFNFTSTLLSSNLYNQISIVSATIQTFFLLMDYLLTLSLILCFFRLLHIQSFGLFTVFVIIGLGTASVFLKSSVMWIFPTANTLIWIHYEEILDKPVFPIWLSFLYFSVAIVILIVCNLIALKKIQFINIEQVG